MVTVPSHTSDGPSQQQPVRARSAVLTTTAMSAITFTAGKEKKTRASACTYFLSNCCDAAAGPASTFVRAEHGPCQSDELDLILGQDCTPRVAQQLLSFFFRYLPVHESAQCNQRTQRPTCFKSPPLSRQFRRMHNILLRNSHLLPTGAKRRSPSGPAMHISRHAHRIAITHQCEHVQLQRFLYHIASITMHHTRC